jgi:3-hydroxy-9,10-secoandrosta-1,3,5(10)-triene-9,17-dione monooxygenase reductase component
MPNPAEDALGPAAEAPDAPPRRPATVDSARFRQVLGHFVTGVTVITAVHDGGPVGLAVNSFTSISLEPPLVAFGAAKSSTTYPSIQAAGRWCVNILAEDQEDVSRLFATRGADKFRGMGWRPAASGAPILAGVLAWIDCVTEVEHDAGDHLIVVGRVLDLEVARDERPLVFFRGGYGRFEV